MERSHNHNWIARVVGGLFFLSTFSYMFGNGMVTIPADADALLYAAAHGNQMIAGVLLQLVNSAAVVAMGVLLFVAIKPASEATALGYAGARLIEGLLLALGGIATLVLVGLAPITPPNAGAEAMVNGLQLGSRIAYHCGMLALGIGSIPFCWVLFRTRMIPRGLAILGVVGYLSLALGSGLELYGINLNLLHNIPGGIFELILPIWLLVRGFQAQPV